jgi:hypothetical protein
MQKAGKNVFIRKSVGIEKFPLAFPVHESCSSSKSRPIKPISHFRASLNNFFYYFSHVYSLFPKQMSQELKKISRVVQCDERQLFIGLKVL